MHKTKLSEVDTIVVGTGPGGAPVALELARAGESVLMVERGARHERALGFPFGPRILEGAGLFCRSKEGVYIARGITVGGSSMVYNANVFDPTQKIYESMDLDFRPEIDELKQEIGVRTLPEKFFANLRGTARVLEVADKMGLPFREQEKFIDPDKCVVGCDMCMLGCARGAKWTTRNLVDQAVRQGAELLHSSAVRRVVIENGKARGIELSSGRRIASERVIVSAGGVGTPALLLRSGLKGVGTHFFIDPMNVVIGYTKKPGAGAWREMTFTHALESLTATEGFLIGNLSGEGALMTSLMRMNVMTHNLTRFPKARQAMGLFVKLSDSPHGQVTGKGRISKPYLDVDRKRMKNGTDLARDMLIRAGVAEDSIAVGQGIGGHPGGTAAMGRVVDREFRTSVENLYVCDGSVLPQSPGVPPSLTIMGLSRLFGKMLTGKAASEERHFSQKAA